MTKRRAILGVLMAIALGGCATTGASPSQGSDDPFKVVNKETFAFNKHLDKGLIKPTAEAYVDVVPLPLRRGVSDVFANLGDIEVIINESLQGRWWPVLSESARLLVNSTLGLLGVVDVATPMGLLAHQADFGETLAVWGVRSGPYIVLPLFGPSDVRDGFGLGVDTYTNPTTYLASSAAMWGAYTAQLIDTRSHYLHQGFLIEMAAGGQEYTFVRDAFWQKRRNLIRSRRAKD
ncbi:MAG TPA: VacJ family lipoprotein [Acidiferrobacter sp.]|nr:VacJ family lipoprotein [Acidiferrobacter sp.]